VIDPDQSETGANGSAICRGVPLGGGSGVGGIPASCEWPGAVGGDIAGVVSFSALSAHLLEDETAECP
jgi:hypothetical protein